MKKHNYKNLRIWSEGVNLSEQVYDYADDLPDKEKFGMWSQITRAAVSAPSNIAEGSARSDRNFKNYLRMSLGSSFELETQLIICQRRKYGQAEKLTSLIEEVQKEQRMIFKFMNGLPDNPLSGTAIPVILALVGLLSGIFFF